MSSLIWTYRIENSEDWKESVPSLEEILSESSIDLKTVHSLLIIYDEVLANIFNHSTRIQDLKITIKLYQSSDQLRLTFIDNTAPYNPLETPNKVHSTGTNIGGWGISIIKKLSDELKYEYEDGHNIFTILIKPHQ